jgi:hypothetical protein
VRGRADARESLFEVQIVVDRRIQFNSAGHSNSRCILPSLVRSLAARGVATVAAAIALVDFLE